MLPYRYSYKASWHGMLYCCTHDVATLGGKELMISSLQPTQNLIDELLCKNCSSKKFKVIYK